MHGTTRGRAAPKTMSTANAVVWLGQGRAIVLRDAGPDGLDEAEVALPDFPGATPVALAEIAHHIGAVDRVLVLGTEDLRTALEREIVAIGHAPDTIRESQIEGPVDRDVLLAKLRRLA